MSWFASQQKADLVFFLHCLPLKVGELRSRVGALRFEPVQIQLGDRALIQFDARDSHGVIPGFERPPGNLNLQIQLPQVEIGFGHCADQPENDRPLALLARE